MNIDDADKEMTEGFGEALALTEAAVSETPITDRLIQLIAQYGVQTSETKELAPTTEFAEMFKNIERIERLLADPQKPVTDTCTWSEDEDGNWFTGCGNAYIISEGTPSENKMAFCCYCGKPLQEVLFKEV
ncbi:MAG: hypothetical protein NUV75_02060 [Gallionella sp.]|nr:hypothetical protein [Gallionella sp.]